MEIALPYRFKPYSYQARIMQARDRGAKRIFACLHRRSGKDKTSLNIVAKETQKRVGSYFYFLPTLRQGRKIIWNGIDKDGMPYLEHIPRSLRAGDPNNTEMMIRMKNGSIFQVVGSDNYDAVMGTNPIGVIFSEWSLSNAAAWDYIRPILLENGGWVIFNGTPRGYNHFKDLNDLAKKLSKMRPKEWFYMLMGVNDTKKHDGSPVLTPEAIQAERESGMAEDLIQQEYYCSFDRGIEGSYYGKLMIGLELAGQITNVPHDPATAVYTAWDLGIDDTTVIWFIQRVGQEIHIIDYYENSGEGIAHYARVLQDKREEFGYVYKDYYAPHDIEARELGTGKSRKEIAKSLGINFKTVPKLLVEDGIEATRVILPRCWFDEEKCDRGIRGLQSYRKEYNEKMKCYSNRPLHDWASNPADAFRMLAVMVEKIPSGSPLGGILTQQSIQELEARYWHGA